MAFHNEASKGHVEEFFTNAKRHPLSDGDLQIINEKYEIHQNEFPLFEDIKKLQHS